jgi:hypothetical protein
VSGQGWLPHAPRTLVPLRGTSRRGGGEGTPPRGSLSGGFAPCTADPKGAAGAVLRRRTRAPFQGLALPLSPFPERWRAHYLAVVIKVPVRGWPPHAPGTLVPPRGTSRKERWARGHPSRLPVTGFAPALPIRGAASALFRRRNQGPRQGWPPHAPRTLVPLRGTSRREGWARGHPSRLPIGGCAPCNPDFGRNRRGVAAPSYSSSRSGAAPPARATRKGAGAVLRLCTRRRVRSCPSTPAEGLGVRAVCSTIANYAPRIREGAPRLQRRRSEGRFPYEGLRHRQDS